MKKKNYFKALVIIMTVMFVQHSGAQSLDYIAQQKENAAAKQLDVKWAAGPIAGFKTIKELYIYDIGVQVSRPIATGKHLRFELSYRFANSNLDQNWGKIPMKMKSDIESIVLGAGYDWFPFVGKSDHGKFLKSVKVISGLWYVNKPEYFFDASLQDPLKWGELTISAEEIGNVATTIKTNKVQPFLGLGYDTFYLSNKVKININGGMLYQGEPKVTMHATNMLKPTEESAVRLQENLKSYQFTPFVQLSVQFNLK